MTTAPTVGVPFRVNEHETIVPTYVRESELPRSDGACVTANLADPSTFTPAGWYVEFHYPGKGETYRRFIAWPTERVKRDALAVKLASGHAFAESIATANVCGVCGAHRDYH